MHKSIRATGVALSLIALTACSNKSNDSQLSGDLNLSALAADASISADSKAEQYAKAGEQLAQSSSFALAEPVLDQALSLDPSNKRAQFYKAVMAQNMALRGVLVRIKPLVRQNPSSVADYNKAVSELPKGALRDFLMDGKEDIKNEKDVQALVDAMHEGREQLRNFLKSNKDLELTLRLSDLAAGGASKKDCQYTQTSEGNYHYSCDQIIVTEAKMNRADVEAMQQMVAGAQVYSILLNSYDLTGSIATAKKLQNTNAKNNQIMAELVKVPEFAKLRNQNLTKIAEMGMDAVGGIRWAAEIQKELCPAGEQVANSRPGHVFSDGICIEQKNGADSLEAILQQVELALSGQSMAAVVNGVATELNYAAPLNSPVADLKTLDIEIDNCGRVSSTSDATAAGILPKGDAAQVLGAARPCLKQ